MEIKLTTDETELIQYAELMSQSEPFVTLRFDFEKCKFAVKGDEVYLAMVDGVMVGFVVLRLTGVLRGYIQTICLKPAFRGKGIGTALLQFCEERIYKMSPNVFICVSSFNHEAQKLYTHLGFEKIGELKNHIVQGHDEYILRKSKGPIMEFKPID